MSPYLLGHPVYMYIREITLLYYFHSPSQYEYVPENRILKFQKVLFMRETSKLLFLRNYQWRMGQKFSRHSSLAKKKLFLDTVLIWRMILILGLYGRNNRRGLTIIRTLIKYSLFLLKYKYQLHEYINIYKAI